jgi:hypothetical protein
MADQQHLETIFLSASVPLEGRDSKYFGTADVLAIRDAVRALATVVIPHARLVWGGHPAITPLIRYVMGRMNSSVKDQVTLYQSGFFEKYFPPDNKWFEEVVIVPANEVRESSLLDMRRKMFTKHTYAAGIFIGGMEGVEDEFAMFNEFHPDAILLPVATTGAAAKLIYDGIKDKVDSRLEDDYAYMALFTDLLKMGHKN